MTKQRYFILDVGLILDTVSIVQAGLQDGIIIDYKLEKGHLIEIEKIPPFILNKYDLGEVNTKSNDFKEILDSVRANVIVYRYNECEIYHPGDSLKGATEIVIQYYDYPELEHIFRYNKSTKWTMFDPD